jgi:hypothetical protein
VAESPLGQIAYLPIERLSKPRKEPPGYEKAPVG